MMRIAFTMSQFQGWLPEKEVSDQVINAGDAEVSSEFSASKARVGRNWQIGGILKTFLLLACILKLP